MNNEKINTYIDDIRHAATVAELNYEIWWVYKGKRADIVNILNTYEMFFQTSIHAHFVALLVALYRIYEKRKDTINIKELLKLIDKAKPFSPEQKNEIENIMTEANALWIKVSILRNEAFGHRSNQNSVGDAFKKAGITYDEFKNLVELTKLLINKITHYYQRSTHAFNLGATNSLMALLNDLKELSEIRSNHAA
jgi:hypothetical protein